MALGRAMVRDPQVFLFDEPLSNLDAKLRVQMRAEIKRLHRRVGSTMIYVTHDQVEAMTLGDRIAVMRKGVLQQVADPFTLYQRPANQFVAGFIGSPPINFFRGTLKDGGVLAVEGTSLTLPPPIAQSLAGSVGRPITVGVRPEDLTLTSAGPDAVIEGVVEVREPLGNEVLLHWQTPVGELVSRVPGQVAPQVGERTRLHAAYDKLHFFDPDTELALGRAAEPVPA